MLTITRTLCGNVKKKRKKEKKANADLELFRLAR